MSAIGKFIPKSGAECRMDAERTRVLWVGHGNSRAAIRPFFEQLGERCQQIEAVAMDMNTAFDLEQQDGHQATSMPFITRGMDDFVNAAPLWSWQGW